MVLKYHISPFPTLLEDMVVKIWEAQSDGPGAEVYTQDIPQAVGGGFPLPTTITVNGLDRVVHIVRLYTATTVALLHEYNVEPLTESAATVFDPIRFKVGDGGPTTPAAGQPTYTDPALAGLTDVDYTVFRTGYGSLIPNIHYTVNVDGFSLSQPGDVFGLDEEYLIQRKPQITTTVNDSVVGKGFAGFIDIAADTNYIPAHLRNLIRFSGSPKYTFAVGTAMPIGYSHRVQHFGAAGTATVQFLNFPLLFGGATRDHIDIPQYTEAEFSFDGAFWNVVYISTSAWVAGPNIPVGATVGVGRYAVGDVPGGDPEYVINHGLNVPGDYMVLFSLQSSSPATRGFDNDVMGVWYHDVDKPNKFRVCLQERFAGVQNLNICWQIIKL